ncbi:unnamed protein product [Didymodactylos carnosus]|uniref:Protein kinase domain-containing protein n=1 Tax=Didymodactylos carnosus TaxID=1234261 RepID=A0A8S2GI89_9BILA|nr:unnamed protein product [Didymodactylos carnosus]CAF3521637.1 unnamed protein product [Didymodactylos carnosus]
MSQSRRTISLNRTFRHLPFIKRIISLTLIFYILSIFLMQLSTSNSGTSHSNTNVVINLSLIKNDYFMSKSMIKDPSIIVPQLRRLPHVQYLIRNHLACHSVINRTVDVILMVLTRAKSFERRHELRRTWAKPRISSSNLTIKVVFIVGIDETSMAMLKWEETMFRDIVVINVPEQYEYVNFKEIFALKWTNLYCPNALFVGKADDDVVINVFYLLNYISQLQKSYVKDGPQPLIAYGNLRFSATVLRTGRYFVGIDEYPLRYNPPYLYGIMYFMTKTARDAIVEASNQKHNLLRIGDVYITGNLIFLTKFFLQISVRDDHRKQSKNAAKCSQNSFVPSSIIENNLQFPLTQNDFKSLISEELVVATVPCSTNETQLCLSLDKNSFIGSGSYGIVVRAGCNKVTYPVAVKFLKPQLVHKLEIVTYTVTGRYNRIDPNTIGSINKVSTSKEQGLLALQILTEANVQSVPKYVTYIETDSYKILVMELFVGFQELSKIIDTLKSTEYNYIACQVAAISCNMDMAQVYHDDMNERNILVDFNTFDVNLIDFGGTQMGPNEHDKHHFTSASNFLKQPIQLLSSLKRVNGQKFSTLLDNIQSQERKVLGTFCKMMDIYTKSSNNETNHYNELFTKYWKIIKKSKQFKCERKKNLM